jgi:hypothetical protein
MTRLQKAAAIIALALCFAGAIGMEIWQASNSVHVAVNQDAAKKKESAAYVESPKESTEQVIARYNKWLTIFTAILAAATVGLGFATVGLYFVNHNQLRHARRVERAYVKLSHRAPGIAFGTKPSIDLHIDVTNHGRTPATVSDVVITPLIWPKDKPLPKIPPYENLWGPGKNPGGFLVCDDHFVVASSVRISEEEFSAIQEGTHDVFMIGFVDYIDQFEERHRCGYGQRYDRHREIPTNLISITERGYEYDRERVPGEGRDWNEDS